MKLEPLMFDRLRPRDVIDGSSVSDHPGIYVLGSYDRRITFYSQQVRALSLVHALQVEGYLRANPRIAVIGGGAAGTTAAAAAALVTKSEVVLFERHQQLLPLQAATRRRKLDPHIFDWPEWDTDDPIADLPILDWTAGPARDVRVAVTSQFQGMVTVLHPRLQTQMRHDVRAINPIGGSYELVIVRDSNEGEGPELRVETRDRFDIVFLAIGFGVEPPESLPGIPGDSYWSDAGVPQEEFEGRAHPSFFVSGNGDGALIDLVAAGSAAFDHARMIRTIVGHPGIGDIFDSIRAIDARAREADSHGDRLDFLAAYDVEILPTIDAIGIMPAVQRLLRTGVQLTLHTKHPEMFVVTTSALNRLAAYLIMRACRVANQSAFVHVHCKELDIIAAPAAPPYQARHWLNCAGTIVGADHIIVRRGPDRGAARTPFAHVLAGFDAAHHEWLMLHGEATLVPRLSPEARSLFETEAKRANVQLAPHVQAARAALRIESVQIRPVKCKLRWSGTLDPQRIAVAWNTDGPRVEVACPAAPSDLGPVAAVVIRLVTHAPGSRIVADPGRWRRFAENLSSDSPHGEGLRVPLIEAGAPGTVNRDPADFDPLALAATLNGALDRWVLIAIDDHIEEYLATGKDTSRRVGFSVARPLRLEMRVIWREWKAAFEEDTELLGRFLRLLSCAIDDAASIEVAQVLVGPSKLTALIRGTTVALAVATGWRTTKPHSDQPGNLLWQRNGIVSWTGHVCAADQINGKAMSLRAAAFMWRTHFVILSVQGSIDVALRAEETFATTGVEEQPRLSDPGEAGHIVMSIDASLTAAMEDGSEAVARLLAEVEQSHFAKLKRTIVKSMEAQSA